MSVLNTMSVVHKNIYSETMVNNYYNILISKSLHVFHSSAINYSYYKMFLHTFECSSLDLDLYSLLFTIRMQPSITLRLSIFSTSFVVV